MNNQQQQQPVIREIHHHHYHNGQETGNSGDTGFSNSHNTSSHGGQGGVTGLAQHHQQQQQQTPGMGSQQPYDNSSFNQNNGPSQQQHVPIGNAPYGVTGNGDPVQPHHANHHHHAGRDAVLGAGAVAEGEHLHHNHEQNSHHHLGGHHAGGAGQFGGQQTQGGNANQQCQGACCGGPNLGGQESSQLGNSSGQSNAPSTAQHGLGQHQGLSSHGDHSSNHHYGRDAALGAGAVGVGEHMHHKHQAGQGGQSQLQDGTQSMGGQNYSATNQHVQYEQDGQYQNQAQDQDVTSGKKPSGFSKLAGKFESAIGKVTKDPEMVMEGQNRQAGLPVISQGNTQYGGASAGGQYGSQAGGANY